jgi:uncharacterized protein (TIGR01777 family)
VKRVVIAGGSGFIGRALAGALRDRGYDVVILTRSPARPGDIYWDGRTLGEWANHIDGARAVVNLAGKNVNCRYTRRNLAEIDQSRVNAVRAIGGAIARCDNPPKVLIQASTTAIYGDAGERWCDESTPIGRGVPVDTATQWEGAFRDRPTPRTRRVTLRMSFVLGRGGGVLGMLSMLTRCFLGGRVGGGRQYISWIHIDDLMRMFLHAIEDESLEGLFIASGPNPVTNADFMRSLRRAHHRPWSPPTPAWAVHVGSFFLRTEPVLALTGRRCVPRRFLDAGFQFQFPDLDAALADIIAPPVSSSPPARARPPRSVPGPDRSAARSPAGAPGALPASASSAPAPRPLVPGGRG